MGNEKLCLGLGAKCFLVLVLVFVLSLGMCGCVGFDQVQGNLTYVGVPCEEEGECPDTAVPKVGEFYLLKERYDGYGSYLPFLGDDFHEEEVLVSGSKTVFEVRNTTYRAIITSSDDVELVK